MRAADDPVEQLSPQLGVSTPEIESREEHRVKCMPTAEVLRTDMTQLKTRPRMIQLPKIQALSDPKRAVRSSRNRNRHDWSAAVVDLS